MHHGNCVQRRDELVTALRRNNFKRVPAQKEPLSKIRILPGWSNTMKGGRERGDRATMLRGNWAHKDLNLGPTDYESVALTN